MPSDARGSAPKAQRADARRNVAAILDAATDCLARDPETSISDIAAAEDAAAGRVKPEDAAGLITATLLAAFTPPAEPRQAKTTPHPTG